MEEQEAGRVAHRPRKRKGKPGNQTLERERKEANKQEMLEHNVGTEQYCLRLAAIGVKQGARQSTESANAGRVPESVAQCGLQ